jgi:hypothetical protein
MNQDYVDWTDYADGFYVGANGIGPYYMTKRSNAISPYDSIALISEIAPSLS